MYVENSLQNRFVFLISLFDLSAILKIRNGEHAHYVGLVVAYIWNREKQMFVALGKEFDMRMAVCIICTKNAIKRSSFWFGETAKRLKSMTSQLTGKQPGF